MKARDTPISVPPVPPLPRGYRAPDAPKIHPDTGGYAPVRAVPGTAPRNASGTELAVPDRYPTGYRYPCRLGTGTRHARYRYPRPPKPEGGTQNPPFLRKGVRVPLPTGPSPYRGVSHQKSRSCPTGRRLARPSSPVRRGAISCCPTGARTRRGPGEDQAKTRRRLLSRDATQIEPRGTVRESPSGRRKGRASYRPDAKVAGNGDVWPKRRGVAEDAKRPRTTTGAGSVPQGAPRRPSCWAVRVAGGPDPHYAVGTASATATTKITRTEPKGPLTRYVSSRCLQMQALRLAPGALQ